MLLFGITKVDHRRSANGIATSQRPNDPKVSTTSKLINNYEIVKPVPFTGVDVTGKPLTIEVIGCEGKRSYGSISEFRMTLLDLRLQPVLVSSTGSQYTADLTPITRTYFWWYRSLPLPFFTEWYDVGVHILSDLFLQSPMRFVIVGAVVAVEPKWVGEWDI